MDDLPFYQQLINEVRESVARHNFNEIVREGKAVDQYPRSSDTWMSINDSYDGFFTKVKWY